MGQSLDIKPDLGALAASLAHDLRAAGFEGDIAGDHASLAAAATDNSIYTIRPHMLVSPKNRDDVVILLRVMARAPYEKMPITARGGGTGTNGQSLNSGVIVDFQRHMNRLLTVNVDEEWAEVEPGIVLDRLNTLLEPTGLFFAPNTSTSSRCTVGGMVSTDASGKGSRHYGKTSDNLHGLEMVLEGGVVLDSSLPAPKTCHALLEAVESACADGRPHLLGQVPALSRRFTGYDLEKAKVPDRPLEWWRLPIGAEGTLGLITRIRVRLRRKPRVKRLIVLAFDTFAAALHSGTALLRHDPLAIEVMDEWVQRIAAEAGLLNGFPAALRGTGDRPIAYSFVEFVGDDAAIVDRQVAALREDAASLPGLETSYVPRDDADMASLWQVRAASVGLLGRVSGKRSPIAFVEDSVVPIENLAPFVQEFNALMDACGLRYGIYGHVDVGCLHVRPALDMGDAGDQALMSRISDGVFELTRKYGGIFWGEHGKGVRGAYLSAFVGAEAYRAFQRIKRAFDPHYRFNPGKLVGEPQDMLGITTTPLRPVLHDEGDPLHLAFKCNGNAQCMSYQHTTVMCPSFKATRDIRHSPKGRADALRAWYLADPKGQTSPDLIEDVRAALDGCLGCKACATTCPVQVDIPEMKSYFLSRYYRSRRRTPGDFAALLLEDFSPSISRMRRLAALATKLAEPLVSALTGLVALPRISPRGLRPYDVLAVAEAEGTTLPSHAVLILQDPFSALFDTEAALAVADGLAALGYAPSFIELMPGGKAAHVLGDRDRFMRHAQKLHQAVGTLRKFGKPIIGVDPAFVMMLRQEYRKAGLGISDVLLVQEFLSREIAHGRSFPRIAAGTIPAKLFVHCSENAAGAIGGKTWKDVFGALGVGIETPATGCCGMAGLYGHQARNQIVSRKAFDLSWAEPLGSESEVMVTGFSCRCQTGRFASATPAHPMHFIARALQRA